ncbi:MAG: bacteriohemerythrin [Treponema sp.]|jgi:hemerythrin|nr:bacteriohemerythrin [Treponema sp.]
MENSQLSYEERRTGQDRRAVPRQAGQDRRVVPRQKEEHVTWSNRYSMGIKLIDDQHKGLLDFVNELFNNSTGDEEAEREYFNKVMAKAVDYVKVHFATEERYMLGTGFPDYFAHKKTHQQFIIKVVESIKDFQRGKRLVLVSFARFLKDWVLSHVAMEDVKYSEYFKKIATRKSDGKLSITAEDIKKLQQMGQKP